METARNRDHRLISIWLFAGVIMIFVQIMLGGITRLTGSGLSITRWDIVTGTIPPLSAGQWQDAFDLYKATPQYKLINEGIDLRQFKFIFFWEYIHRLWARLMGFVFVIPFLVFLIRKSLGSKLLRRLGIVIILAALAAIFGWIMVYSGLVKRPWVNAYKLTIHLALGISLFVYLFFTWLSHRGYARYPLKGILNNLLVVILSLVIIQLAFGGFVSGMKAALNYPTWPLMHGEYLPSILLDKSHWNIDTFLLYDQSGFMAAFVQFIHRNLAYLIASLVFLFSVKWIVETPSNLHWIAWVLIGIIVVQLGLGIITLLKSIGSIPVLFGALHQGIGILLVTFLIFIYQTIKLNKV
ncbi:MAG TPA: COX15/CtaA family protein [Saprospiraceae bacterium]|nr:COX15/CtaA family protein [Saprospiraceae bacterium]